MVIASFVHLLVGFLFGIFGFRVHVLILYGLVNVVIGVALAFTGSHSGLEAVGYVALTMGTVSIGFGIGAVVALWRGQARERDAVGIDRLPKLFGGLRLS